MITNHGTFRQYQPELADDHPYKKHRVLFLKNEFGVDWYSIAHAKPDEGRTFVSIQGGRVMSLSDDPSSLFPVDCLVVETDAIDIAIGHVFNGATFSKPGVTRDQVNAEAQRRIATKFPIHDQINVVRGAKQRPGMWDWIDAVRTAAAALEAQSPIPEDFRANKHWPAQ